ncbi:MAG: VPLPA-CTERM sorting domain-containing protein [Nitrospira sp.]|nr:VPLPA-CTERM sorting domain-containing protein [Nitrospira sp.]
MKQKTACAIAAVLSLSLSSLAVASTITDIGYTALQNELGAATPTGAGVKVTQVEAPTNDTSGGAAPIFMPDPTVAEFAGKSITAINGNPSGSFSGHATEVGRLFYGHGRSIASGVTQIDSYEATDWLNSLSISAGPMIGAATTSASRIANHSWIGAADQAAQNGTILRTVDRQVQLNEYVQVAGLANGNSDQPLLGSAYNVIAVGRTDGIHQQTTVAVAGDSLYGTIRIAPHLVAPESTTSAATPVVSAAAAVLAQTGHDGGLTLSKGSTVIAGIGAVYNAERSETVKAALMAGADRETFNSSTSANITDYRSAGHQTANGLDDRYGAGQVNILNSYHIVAGGEQDSLQQGGSDIGRFGFDYAGAFGGLNGSPRTASYFFNAPENAMLFSSLVWNVGVSNNSAFTTTLHNLNLSLYDVTLNALMAQSSSTVDNTENLWVELLGGNRYELRVTAGNAANSSWDYALAWRMEGSPAPVPIPAAIWLFGSGLAGLVAMARRRKAASITVTGAHSHGNEAG